MSRDTEHANGSISPIFDKEKEQKRLEMAQMLGDIGVQAADIARTAGEIEAIKAGKAELVEKGITPPGKEGTKEQWDAYNAALKETGSYKDTQQQYGTGSAFQQGISAATMALQGLAGGDIKAAIAGGLSPYLAEVVKKATGDNQEANIIAHAVVNAAIAAVQGKDAAAGAAGAVTGELVGIIAVELYGRDTDKLTESEKQKVSALATLAAALAGGLTGDSSVDAMTGAIAGKTTVENNVLGCSPTTCPNSLGDDIMHGGGMGGGTAGGAAGAGIGAIIAGMFGDDESTVNDTGGDQIVDQGPTNTGGNQQFDQNGIPTNTGNTESGNISSNNTGNTDSGIDTGGNTTTTPIAEQNKDDFAYLSLKGKESQAAASNLGFDRRIPPQKAPFNSHGQPVYFDGKNYITPDVDSHNVTNGWKMFDRKGERMGTYDSDLNRIKD